MLARSGGVFYGGLIGATAVAFWYIRRHALPLWTTCDMFAPGIALGHVIGRLGCLAAGCCYGTPTARPWGITFTDPFAALNVGTPLNIALHPTQVYEAGAELLILVWLLATERKGRPFPGRTFFRALYFAPYVLGVAVIGLLWRFLLDANLGFVNHLLGLIGLPSDTPWVYKWYAVVSGCSAL